MRDRMVQVGTIFMVDSSCYRPFRSGRSQVRRFTPGATFFLDQEHLRTWSRCDSPTKSVDILGLSKAHLLQYPYWFSVECALFSSYMLTSLQFTRTSDYQASVILSYWRLTDHGIMSPCHNPSRSGQPFTHPWIINQRVDSSAPPEGSSQAGERLRSRLIVHAWRDGCCPPEGSSQTG